MVENQLKGPAEMFVAEFVRSQEMSYVSSWSVTSGGWPTQDEIVLVVVRRRKIVEEMATAPGDQICPLCGGTGSL